MTNFRKLYTPTGLRMEMLKTMVSQLVKHERIETSVRKAKEFRRLPDNMVQLGKEDTLSAARCAAAFVRGDDIIHKFFTEMAFSHKVRAGEDTRLLRNIGVGDAALMACIEFVNRENELKQSKSATRCRLPPRAPLDLWSLVDPWGQSHRARQNTTSLWENLRGRSWSHRARQSTTPLWENLRGRSQSHRARQSTSLWEKLRGSRW